MPSDDPLLENDHEAFLSVVFDDAKKKKKTTESGSDSRGSSNSNGGSGYHGGGGNSIKGWGAALSMGSAGDDLRCRGPELRRVSREEAVQLQAEAAATFPSSQVNSAAASAAVNTARAAGMSLDQADLLDGSGGSSGSSVDASRSHGARFGIVSAFARVLAVAAACAVLREWSVASHRRRNTGHSSTTRGNGSRGCNTTSSDTADSSPNTHQSTGSHKGNQNQSGEDDNDRLRRGRMNDGEIVHAFGASSSFSDLLANVARALGFGFGFLSATAKVCAPCDDNETDCRSCLCDM